jgi:hypothetical protein
MPRRLRRDPIQEDQVIALGLIAKAAEDPIPHDPRLLRAMVRAQQARLAQLSPDQWKLVAMASQWLAAIEREPILSLAPKIREKQLYGPILGMIAFAKAQRGNHYKGLLQIQRNLLAHYLAVHPFPSKEMAKRWMWMKEH